MMYKTRRHQIEAEVRAHKKGRQSLAETVRSAAFIGGCEARDQALTVIRKHLPQQQAIDLENLICKIGIHELLGWKK